MTTKLNKLLKGSIPEDLLRQVNEELEAKYTIGWLEAIGGRPVQGHVIVDVMFRNGDTDTVQASQYLWCLTDKDDDIVKWRLARVNRSVTIKTDNTQVIINQDKKIAELQLKLDEQIAYSAGLIKGIDVLSTYCIPPCPVRYPTSRKAVDKAIALLDQTPTQSLNKLKSDVIRECAADMYDYDISTDHDAYHACIDVASKILKEGE